MVDQLVNMKNRTLIVHEMYGSMMAANLIGEMTILKFVISIILLA